MAIWHKRRTTYRIRESFLSLNFFSLTFQKYFIALLRRGDRSHSPPWIRHWLWFKSRYDTIRDAILTCAGKPTWIGLIYRTETTTEKCKTEKLKSKSRYVRSNSKSLGNHVVRSEKKKGCSGKDLQKKVLSLEWKREWVMKNNNN